MTARVSPGLPSPLRDCVTRSWPAPTHHITRMSFSLELMELSVGVPSLSAEKGLGSLKILDPCS